VRPRGKVIAIDGPSGAGKSTAGRALAERLAYTFIDTGAMYRALALKAARAAVDPADGGAVAALLHGARIELQDGGRRVWLDGEDVSEPIRAPEISALASRVSAHTAVRREMVARQRALGAAGGVVLDGRDIGTAVFPDADVKFYLDADPTRRAERRLAELAVAGRSAELEAVRREIRARDQADMTRADSPLTRAEGAIVLDTTALTPEQVLERMLEAVRAT
jgi:cytidylate kinase